MNSPASSRTSGPNERRKSPRRAGWVRRLVMDVLFVARRDKKLWLLPLIILLLLIAALLVFATVAGPLAPFIYPIL